MKSEKVFDGKPVVDVSESSFGLAVRVVEVCKFLKKHGDVIKSLSNQLLLSATSVGANLEKAVAGQSRSDFIHISAIALEEAREAKYWLRLIMERGNIRHRYQVRNFRPGMRIPRNC